MFSVAGLYEWWPGKDGADLFLFRVLQGLPRRREADETIQADNPDAGASGRAKQWSHCRGIDQPLALGAAFRF